MKAILFVLVAVQLWMLSESCPVKTGPDRTKSPKERIREAPIGNCNIYLFIHCKVKYDTRDMLNRDTSYDMSLKCANPITPC